ncbi:MAG: hypothetical protein KAW45_03150 [Thermoplasmatales archaeon]|nr:hypothetical protein [Thermoplasmatales archaeon]
MKGKIRERILRILLTHSDGSLYQFLISKEARCSQPWAHSFLNKLEKKKLIKETRVINIQGLFSYWLEINEYPNYREYNVQNPLDLLKKTNLKYALTTYYGEYLTQNYLFPSRVEIYIQEGDAISWHELLTANGLVGKGNFRLFLDDEHIFYHNIKKKNFRIVSIPQLILDLLREKGVAEEAGKMLMSREYHAFISKN